MSKGIFETLTSQSKIPYPGKLSPHQKECPVGRVGDGSATKAILAKYLDNMREAVNPDGSPRRWKLTGQEKLIARDAWARQLAALQTEQKAKDASREVTVVTQSEDD